MSMKTLGLISGHVTLMRAHDAWAVDYERERDEISAALRGHMSIWSKFDRTIGS